MPIEKLKSLFSDPSIPESELAETINSMDHFDLARLLPQFELEEKVKIFQLLDNDTKRQELLYETHVESRKELVEALGHEFMAPFLEGMAKDEAADILQEHKPEVQEKILEKMVPVDAQTLKNLIQYGEETAGGLMTPLYNKVSPNDLSGEILMKMIRSTDPDQGSDFYVVRENNELVGHFTLRDLLHVQPNIKAENIIHETTPKVHLEDKCEIIADIMDQQHLSAIPVIDDRNILHGVITFDDVLRGLKKTVDEEIYTMAGTAKVDPFAKKTSSKIKARAPWLFTTFVGGFLSALILHKFEFTLAEYTTVLFLIPFVLGLAGNVGIQGATVIVRGFATGDIQADNLNSVVFSEIKVGVSNGLIFGSGCGLIILALAKPVLNTDPILGLTLGLGIVLAVSMASLIGSTLPVFFIKFNIDPAISTGPMVTVINDIIGLFIYLYTTTVIFSALGL